MGYVTECPPLWDKALTFDIGVGPDQEPLRVNYYPSGHPKGLQLSVTVVITGRPGLISESGSITEYEGVWFIPELYDRTPQAWAKYMAECAIREMERLRNDRAIKRQKR